MAVMFLRTLRLDASDTFVFERAAASGEWAVSGSFLFWHEDLSALEGKRRNAFRSGFLGIESFGWSTLAMVQEASEAEREAAIRRLAEQLTLHCGAPDVGTALPAAREEIAFAESLAQHPARTIVALQRGFEAGEIRERFRTLEPGQPTRDGRAFSFVAVDGEELADPQETPEERIDLAALIEGKRP